MKTLRLAAAALAVSGVFSLAKGGESTNDWWNVDFEGLRDYAVEGDTGMVTLTNDNVTLGGVQVSHRPYEIGLWTTQDGDDSCITNDLEGVPAYGDFLRLDTQGTEITWKPDATQNETQRSLIDADILLVGADDPPEISSFDSNEDVQTAVFLRNERDEEDEVVNARLYVYVYDGGTQHNTWVPLTGLKADAESSAPDLIENRWYHIQVVMNYEGENGAVSVFVNGTQMKDDAGKTSWAAANNKQTAAVSSVSSVSFRGTGAVDNFTGRTVEITYDYYDFSFESYVDGELYEGEEEDYYAKENLRVGSAWKVTVIPFDATEDKPISQLFIMNFQTGAYIKYPITVDEDFFPTLPDGAEGLTVLKNGDIQVTFDTTGATGATVAVKAYYGDVPATFDVKTQWFYDGTAAADTVVDSYNSKNISEGETASATYPVSKTVDGTSYVLSRLVPATGVVPTYAEGDVTVELPLAGLADDTVIASVYYVEGSAASLAGKTIVLQADENGAYNLIGAVAKITRTVEDAETTDYYETLEAAIAAVQDKETIEMLADVTLSDVKPLPADKSTDKDVTLDLGGHTLSAAADENFVLHTYGGVVVTNGTVSAAKVFSNYGTLTLTDVEVSATTKYAVYARAGSAVVVDGGAAISGGTTAIYAKADVSVEVKSGTVSTAAAAGAAIYGGASGVKVSVSGGTVSAPDATSNGIVLYGTDSTATVSGGTVSGGNIGIDVGATGGTVVVTGGTVESDHWGIYSRVGGSRITVSGGTIDANVGIGTYGAGEGGSAVTLSGGSISATLAGVYLANADTLALSGTEIEARGLGLLVRGGSATVTGGSIAVTGSAEDKFSLGDATDENGDRVRFGPSAIVVDSKAAYPGYSAANTKVAISGGTFVSTVDTLVWRKADEDPVPFVVSGGWFSAKVAEAYVAEGYTATDEVATAPDATAPYTVAKAVEVSWNVPENATLQVGVDGTAVTAADEKATVLSTGFVVFAATPAEGYTYEGFELPEGWTLSSGVATYTLKGPTADTAVTVPAPVQKSGKPSVNPGDGLADVEGAPAPIAFNAESGKCEVSFVAPEAGYYVLFASATVDGEYVLDAGSATAAAVAKGAVVTLTESATSNAKFFKLGWSATPIPAE